MKEMRQHKKNGSGIVAGRPTLHGLHPQPLPAEKAPAPRPAAAAAACEAERRAMEGQRAGSSQREREAMLSLCCK